MGFSNVTALLGAKVTPEKAEILRDINRPIYWLTDPDIAGRSCLYGHWNAEEETFEGGGALETMYGDVAQFVLEYPEGVDDVDYLTYDQICYMLETADLWMKGIDKRNRKV